MNTCSSCSHWDSERGFCTLFTKYTAPDHGEDCTACTYDADS
jgi:hypothetical protein